MIRANPDLIPQAIEEHLRYSSPIQNLYRYTRADYRVGDVTIPTGSRVMMSFGAANRDPLAFDDPNTFRADRNPRTHVAFGYGPHLCLGAPLARMEAQAVLRELVDRVARISMTGPTAWSTNSSLRGPTHLPLVLDGSARTARRTRSERWSFAGGFALVGSGLAHLLLPRAFEPVNRTAFKDNIRAHVLINGSIEQDWVLRCLILVLVNRLGGHRCLSDLFQRQRFVSAARPA